MKAKGVRTGLWALLALAVVWGAAFALACRLADPSSDGMMSRDGADAMVFKALDASRAAAGGRFFANADRTFHRGVGVYRPSAFTNWLTRLGRAITPGGHAHLHAENVNEVVPWLYLAVRADPHNVEAYVVAAFWLANEGGRPDLAARVLDEARANNPKDYRVYLEKGRLKLKNGALTEAARALDTAGRLWERDAGPDNTQAQLDRAEMLVYRGLLFEEDGDVPRALACYRNILALFPGRTGIRERVQELAEKGYAGAPPAILRQTIMFQHRHVCGREDH